MTMKVIAKINTIITATTPPTMAAVLSVLSSTAVSVVMLSDEVSILVEGIISEGVVGCNMFHQDTEGSSKEEITTGHMSMFTRTP